MRCLLQSLKRLGLRHGLTELPEEVGYAAIKIRKMIKADGGLQPLHVS